MVAKTIEDLRKKNLINSMPDNLKDLIIILIDDIDTLNKKVEELEKDKSNPKCKYFD